MRLLSTVRSPATRFATVVADLPPGPVLLIALATLFAGCVPEASKPSPGTNQAVRANTNPPINPNSGLVPVTQSNDIGEPQTSARTIELIECDWAALKSLIADQNSKIVVVDVWSTACEPCMKEFPHLISLQKAYPNDVVAISFDVDYAGIKNKPVAYYRERVLKFLGSMEENQVKHRMCTTATDELFPEIKLDSIPAVFVFDRTGQLAKLFHGSSDGNEGVSYEQQVIPFVEQLLKSPASDRTP